MHKRNNNNYLVLKFLAHFRYCFFLGVFVLFPLQEGSLVIGNTGLLLRFVFIILAAVLFQLLYL